ncbi:MAG: ligase-associated DNA damage response endonuclease PdeM [Ginsengibacter sp.]
MHLSFIALKLFLISPLRFIFKQQTLWLSPCRCIFWEEESALILSDLHLGKSGHFRKSGIGIPQTIFKEDLHRLFSQIQFFKPKSLIIAGDMFHSRGNKEMDFFLKWRNDISQIEIILIKGNHDILSDIFYKEANIQVIKKRFSIKNFCFTHDITGECEDVDKEFFTFSGHIHPGIKIRGTARQSLNLPCFYFTKDHAVLPAFSLFTGLAKISPLPSDHIFVLTGDNVLKI